VRGTAFLDSEVLFREKLDVEECFDQVWQAFVFQLGGGAETTGGLPVVSFFVPDPSPSSLPMRRAADVGQAQPSAKKSARSVITRGPRNGRLRSSSVTANPLTHRI
jgi:hypothetical protein